MTTYSLSPVRPMAALAAVCSIAVALLFPNTEAAAADTAVPEQAAVLHLLARATSTDGGHCCCPEESDERWMRSIDPETVYWAARWFRHATTFFPYGRYKAVSDRMAADLHAALDEVKRNGEPMSFFVLGPPSWSTGSPSFSKRLARRRAESIWRVVLDLAEQMGVLEHIELHRVDIGHRNLPHDVCSLFDPDDPNTMDDHRACMARNPGSPQQMGFVLVVPTDAIPAGSCEPKLTARGARTSLPQRPDVGRP